MRKNTKNFFSLFLFFLLFFGLIFVVRAQNHLPVSFELLIKLIEVTLDQGKISAKFTFLFGFEGSHCDFCGLGDSVLDRGDFEFHFVLFSGDFGVDVDGCKVVDYRFLD